MESAEIISKALENIDERMEDARHIQLNAWERIGTIESAKQKIASREQFDELNEAMGGVDGYEPIGKKSEVDDAILTLTMELSKVSLEKEEQLIQSMREIQKILFSTRNKRIEEAIKYIEQVCDKNDNNFDNQLLLKKPKYLQWFMRTEYGQEADQIRDKLIKTMDGDSNEVDVTTEITPKESLDDAYKILALVFHPDKGGDTERFKIINNAYNTLKDEDIESHLIFAIFRVSFLYLIYQSDNAETFSNIPKILVEKS